MKSKQDKMIKYVRIRAEMKASPAFRALSLSARRILDRTEIELCGKNGKQNGKLTVTHNNFKEYGMDHNSIGPAIREAVALGFIEITQRGRAGNADQRISNQFRLTYLPTDDSDQTDEWHHIDSEQAKAIARKARREKPDGHYHPRRKFPVLKNRTGRRKSPVRENPKTSPKNPDWGIDVFGPGNPYWTP
jgi:hypothetical protein